MSFQDRVRGTSGSCRFAVAIFVAVAMLAVAGCRSEAAEVDLDAAPATGAGSTIVESESVAESEPSTLLVETPSPSTVATSTVTTESSTTTTSTASTQPTTSTTQPTTTTSAETTSTFAEGVHLDIVKIVPVVGRNPGGDGWKDSYSVGGTCYCATTFDHEIGEVEVATPDGKKTVREVCERIGDGPGPQGRPIYNDIQCGNGPANNAGDEDDCPGRVDIGPEGCGHIGPTWDLTVFE